MRKGGGQNHLRWPQAVRQSQKSPPCRPGKVPVVAASTTNSAYFRKGTRSGEGEQTPKKNGSRRLRRCFFMCPGICHTRRVRPVNLFFDPRRCVACAGVLASCPSRALAWGRAFGWGTIAGMASRSARASLLEPACAALPSMWPVLGARPVCLPLPVPSRRPPCPKLRRPSVSLRCACPHPHPHFLVASFSSCAPASLFPLALLQQFTSPGFPIAAISSGELTQRRWFSYFRRFRRCATQPDSRFTARV